MKIAIFSDNFYPEVSGISDSVLNLGEELIKRGHEIAFVSPKYSKENYSITNSPTDDSPDSRLSKFKIFRIPSIHLPKSITGQSRIAIPFSFSKKFIKDFSPDIIYTQSPFGAGIEALMCAKKFNITLIGTNHTPPEEFFPAIFKKYYAWYYNKCSFISTPSDDLLYSMRKSGFKKDGKSIPNPILLNKFTPATSQEKLDIKEELKISVPVILYTGRLAPEKHVDVIIRAVKRLSDDVKLIITGHGSAKESLVSLVRELKIEDKVIFSGYVDESTLIKFYKIADIFSIMSTAETQSLSLMLAFACGVPAICADAHGLSEYVKNDCGFLIDYDDDKKLAEYFSLFLKNEELRSKMGQAGIIFVKQFSPAKIADVWEEIFNKYKK